MTWITGTFMVISTLTGIEEQDSNPANVLSPLIEILPEGSPEPLAVAFEELAEGREVEHAKKTLLSQWAATQALISIREMRPDIVLCTSAYSSAVAEEVSKQSSRLYAEKSRVKPGSLIPPKWLIKGMVTRCDSNSGGEDLHFTSELLDLGTGKIMKAIATSVHIDGKQNVPPKAEPALPTLSPEEIRLLGMLKQDSAGAIRQESQILSTQIQKAGGNAVPKAAHDVAMGLLNDGISKAEAKLKAMEALAAFREMPNDVRAVLNVMFEKGHWRPKVIGANALDANAVYPGMEPQPYSMNDLRECGVLNPGSGGIFALYVILSNSHNDRPGITPSKEWPIHYSNGVHPCWNVPDHKVILKQKDLYQRLESVQGYLGDYDEQIVTNGWLAR